MREDVLARDEHRCVACAAEPERPHVHHRRPGANDDSLLVTLCPTCHARVHLYASLPAFWVPPVFAALWHEQHPEAALQLQLPFAA